MITQTEQDDSIPTANATGLDATHTGIKVAYGNNGDGAYGYDGDGTGDLDFYKLSAAASQVIQVDLKNYSNNPDFDSYVAIYNASGVKVAENDDADGSGRASKLTYTVTTAGDYYVMVGNWIAGPTNDPTDPFTAGTGPGLPGGTAGPYKLFIGLSSTAPVIQYDGGTSDNPVPNVAWKRVIGSGNRQTTTLKIMNTGYGPYTLSSYAITGTDASKFTVSGPTTPLTLAVGASTTFTLNYNGIATQNTASAVLNMTSNDPLDIDYALTATNSYVVGGGYFNIKQVLSTTAVNSFEVADALLAGTSPGTVYTAQSSVINYSGAGQPQGPISGDARFPASSGTSDNFAFQATGTIYIREEGIYTFRGYADDGQRLNVDGETLIQSGTANQAAYGGVLLTQGPHTIEYTVYEIGGEEGAELAISKDQGEFNAGTAGLTTWELLEAYSADTDGDGLPNDWETAHGLNPNSATGADGATGDPDADGLNNLAEYNAGTDPQNGDTDADGYKDGVETKTGVWVSATNTGTDPLKADTDGDGFKDGVENPTQTTTGQTQPGTDPNKGDTDGDGYGDLAEVILGTDPKLASSFPTFTYTTVLADNFDGVQTNSTYAVSAGGETLFTPAVAASGVTQNAQAMELISKGTGEQNSIAWNQVPLNAPKSFQLTYDFRVGNDSGTPPADGMSVGLFRTATYSTTGASNPGVGKNWENLSASGGVPDVLSVGFSMYPTSAFHLTGPGTPSASLGDIAPGFTIANNLFNRVILTGVTAGSAGTTLSLEVIEDVNGAAISHKLFTNVLAPGFDLPNESVRLMAGARTGLYFERMDLDNVKLAVASGTTTSPAPTISIAKPATGQAVITYTGVLQSSTDLINFTDVAGATSPYTVPVSTATKMFYRSRSNP